VNDRQMIKPRQGRPTFNDILLIGKFVIYNPN
jgi:hypothetical protein